MTALAGDRRTRVLAELGLVRYRLRPGPGAASATRAPDRPEGEPATEVGSARPVLLLELPGMAGPPEAGPAAAVWSQVLAWLRLPGQQVAWSAGDDPAAVALPAPALWLRPEGKQALWQALKSFRAGR